MNDIFPYTVAKSARQLYFELGLLFTQRSKPEKAIEYFKTSLSEQEAIPSDTEIKLALGKAFLQINDNPEAVKIFLSAAVESPGYFHYIIEKAGDYLNEQVVARLSEWIEGAWKDEIKKLTLDDKMSNALQGFWAAYYFSSGNYGKSKEIYSALLDLNPSDSRYLKGIGKIYLKQKDYQQSGSYLYKAREIAAANGIPHSDISFDLINVLLEAAEYESALNEIEDLTASGEKPDGLQYLELKALYGLKRYAEVNALLNELMLNRANAESIEYIIFRIKNCIALHEYERTASLIEDAFKMYPVNNRFLFLKVQTLIEGQINLEEGLKLFSEERYGCRRLLGDERIEHILHLILSERPDDGNAYFFAAFIGNAMDYDADLLNTWLEKAETLGLKNNKTYPLTALYMLWAEIAEKKGEQQLAGKNYFKVARNYYDLANYDKALIFFNKSIECAHALTHANFYAADILFLKSYMPLPPYIDEKLLDQAYEMWNKWGDTLPRVRDEAWHYIVIARIYEAWYKLRSLQAHYAYWEALLYAERAAAHTQADYSVLTYLGRFYRNLDLEANSLAAFEAASKLNSTFDFLVEEKAILYLNTGKFRDAETCLKYMEERSLPYPETWKAFILYHENNYEEAIGLLEKYVEGDQTDIFAYDLLMHICWRAKKMGEAKKFAEDAIVLGSKFNYLKEDLTFSWAYFVSGNARKAISILEDARSAGAVSNNIPVSLVLFYLFDGQVEKATENFDYVTSWICNSRLLKELYSDLVCLEGLLARENERTHKDATTTNKPIAGWLNELDAKLEHLKTAPVSPGEELDNKLEESKFSEGSVPWIALQAGKARVYRENKQYTAARKLYGRLLEYSNAFPEAGLATGQIETEVLLASSTGIKNAEYYQVIQLLQGFDFNNGAAINKKGFYLSLAFYAIDKHKESISNIDSVFSRVGTEDEWWKWLREEIAGDSYNPDFVFNFVQFLYRNCPALQIDSRNLSGVFIENVLQPLANYARGTFAVTLPIVVEISNNLSTGADGQDWYVIKELVPQLREDILTRYGVRLPGIRFRLTDPDLPTDNFIISLEEVPLKMDRTYSDKLLIYREKEQLTIPGIEAEEAVHPLTGKKISWVSGQFEHLLREADISFEEKPFVYIIDSLHSLLLRNLDIFIDTGFCIDYITGLSAANKENKEPGIEGRAAKISESPPLLTLFCQTLKDLVKERVSIADKRVVTALFLDALEEYKEVSEIVTCMRRNMKHTLPVNQYPVEKMQLSLATEEKIRANLFAEAGKIFLAMLPEDCQDVLREIRDAVGRNPLLNTKALMINDPGLRIYVRKLTDMEFPDLIVASGEELI
ncbi:MAG: FHIPEP family type III secretion protein [Chitinophagaceae bacterium]|nr:FHIPEP family type III secretion protein [Chitinophagaceae bacterium]MCW5926441.1 FHIPEP family type III secretion protein [Chitinophagaceae bacterium]